MAKLFFVSKCGVSNEIEMLLQLEGSGMVGNWLFREVLERLLDLVTVPVKQALCQEKTTHSSELVQNCCHLLARVVAELASQSSGTDVSWELLTVYQLASTLYGLHWTKHCDTCIVCHIHIVKVRTGFRC